MVKAYAHLEDFATEYRELLRLRHPDMQQRDVEVLAYKLAEITEHFAVALREAREKGARREHGELPAYRRFKEELEALPGWFENYLRRSY